MLGAPEATSVAAASRLAAEVGPTISPEPSTTAQPPVPLPRALVAVSVAEVWSHYRKVRPFDRPALQRPAHITAWIHGMSFYQRSHLFQRLATQVRYGESSRCSARVGCSAGSGFRARPAAGSRTGSSAGSQAVSCASCGQRRGCGRVATVTAKRAALDRTVAWNHPGAHHQLWHDPPCRGCPAIGWSLRYPRLREPDGSREVSARSRTRVRLRSIRARTRFSRRRSDSSDFRTSGPV